MIEGVGYGGSWEVVVYSKNDSTATHFPSSIGGAIYRAMVMQVKYPDLTVVVQHARTKEQFSVRRWVDREMR